MQERLDKEVSDHLPDSMDAASSIRNAHIDNKHYLNAVCNEVLRLYPPVAMVVPEIVRDTSILGLPNSQWQPASLLPWAVYANPALWAADGMELYSTLIDGLDLAKLAASTMRKARRTRTRRTLGDGHVRRYWAST